MSEDDKSIFPRSSETSDEEKQRLLQETRQKLENQEKTFETNLSAAGQKVYCANCGTENADGSNFCWVCGNSLISSNTAPPTVSPGYEPNPEPASIMYGPPPMMLDANDDIHTTMYGPPPMELRNEDTSGVEMYGPPPMMLNKDEKNPFPPPFPNPGIKGDYFPAPAYGPPPVIGFGKRKSRTLWIIIGAAIGLFFLILIALFVAGLLTYYSLG